MAKIPSTATGKVVAIHFVDDDVIPVGHTMIEIEEEGEGDDEPAAAEPASAIQAASAPVAQSVHTETQVTDKVGTAPPGN